MAIKSLKAQRKQKELNWSGLQIMVTAILTLDVIGGVLTSSLGSMKRYLYLITT
ncbi:hypothetical protein VIC_001159 [Vibrio coralliilyticus ATCC BAA-450]|nr:hypothetical protein VIC_001159 [Vibrio coralliilyticus ATCC BAA-450]